MLPVILSIALLVLLSVAVLTVVAGEGDTQPTSARRPKGGSGGPEPDTLPPPRSPAVEPPPAPAERDPVAAAIRRAAPPVAPARHRLRASVLLVLYVLVAGLLMATAIAAAVAGITVLLRDAVTS